MGPRVNENNQTNWCDVVAQRCKELKKLANEAQKTQDSNEGSVLGFIKSFFGFDNAAEKLDNLIQANVSCNKLHKVCRHDGPAMPFIDVKKEGDKLLEGQSYHDVPAFYEIADPIIKGGYLPDPSSNNGKLNILYPCSGSHIAPFELAFQILEKTGYKELLLTYTEIDEKYFFDLFSELSALKGKGLDLRVTPKDVKDGAGHKERSAEVVYKTSSGEEKRINLNFVLGKRDQATGSYPPYFRQEDFDKAHMVIIFDAEGADETIKYFNEAIKAGESSGKTVIIEDRPIYVEWAGEKGYNISSSYSQHYGCEVPKEEEGGLRPLVFQLK